MSNRFDLEQEIMVCWNVVDDLNTVFEMICDCEKLDRDQIANILLGMKELYQLKFEKLFNTFETSLRN